MVWPTSPARSEAAVPLAPANRPSQEAPENGAMTTGLFALFALAMAGLTVYGSTCLWDWHHPTLWRLMLVQGGLFAAGCVVVFHMTKSGAGPRWLTPAILVLAVLMRLALIPAPTVSTDIFRYVWDGRVQGQMINPYRYIPSDPALESLRDTAIYPSINRKSYAPTIYPPFAQMVFFAATRFAETLTAMKAMMVLFEALTVWGLIRLLKARGLSPARVIVYAWHPLPLWEFAGSGHIDAVSTALMVLAFVAADKRSPVWTGVALALGAVTKFFPIAIGPALWRRWDWRFPLAFAVTALVCYLPYLTVGRKVFGFLGEYMTEEGIEQGSGVYPIRLLRHFVDVTPEVYSLYTPVALMILVVLAGVVGFRRSRPDPDLGGAFLLMTVFTFLMAPHLAWYFTWLIPLLCLRPNLGVFWLTLAAPLLYLPSVAVPGGNESVMYIPFVVAGLADIFWRRGRQPGFPERIAA